MSDSELSQHMRNSALGLLARREHSRRELSQKLSRKYGRHEEFSSSLIPPLLDMLEQSRYQCDERFTESYVNYRTHSSKGPLRIMQELRDKGVSEVLVERFVDETDHKWLTLALSISERRFGILKSSGLASDEDIDPIDQQGHQETQKIRAKQARFLQGRGFTFEHINKVLY